MPTWPMVRPVAGRSGYVRRMSAHPAQALGAVATRAQYSCCRGARNTSRNTADAAGDLVSAWLVGGNGDGAGAGRGWPTGRWLTPMAGHVHDFAQYQRDLDAVLALTAAEGMPGPRMLMGHSMGGCIWKLQALYPDLGFRAATRSRRRCGAS
ncbi:MAG: alpha/beta hydrolase [Rhodobacter sp.]|nr:alpha/beta hydrolase [Rhodobacter sp.]